MRSYRSALLLMLRDLGAVAWFATSLKEAIVRERAQAPPTGTPPPCPPPRAPGLARWCTAAEIESTWPQCGCT